MATFTKEEIEHITHLDDVFGNNIRLLAKNPQTFRKIKAEMTSFFTKNDEKLLTNIVGKQIIFNERNENNLLAALNIKKEDVTKEIKESDYFKVFGELNLTSQLAFAIPLLILANEYNNLKKDEEARFVYLTLFFKPYASRESYYFKYGVNEDQMNYTVEHMSDRFDIHRLGSILDVLNKISEVSFNNYFSNKTKVLSDRDLHVIYTSGIGSRVNSMIGGIAAEYKKNTGKYLSFESGTAEVYDKDSDSKDVESVDIKSDAAIRKNIVDKAVLKLTSEPLNPTFLTLSAQRGFGSASQMNRDLLSNAINLIIDNMLQELPDFFSAMINSFLFNPDKTTGKRWTMEDFKTPVFIRVMSENFRGNNSKDTNLIRVKDTVEKMLSLSDDYIKLGTTKKFGFKNALMFYWILLLRDGGK